MQIGLINEMKIRAQQRNQHAAAAYRQALQHSEEFWRFWYLMPDALPQKESLRSEYFEIMSMPNKEE